MGGGAEDVWGDLKFFGKGQGGKRGLVFFFLHLLKKETLVCGFFFMKEDHLNYSGRATRVVQPLKHSVVKCILVFKW